MKWTTLRFATRATAIVLCSAMSSVSTEAAKPDSGKQTVKVQEFEKVAVQKFDWGWIRWLMNAEIDPDAEMTFGVVWIKAHQENPLHLHPNSAEYLHVVEGSCEHLVGDTWLKLKTGDTVRIPKNVPHKARTTDQSCRAVIVYNTGKRQFVPLNASEAPPKTNRRR